MAGRLLCFMVAAVVAGAACTSPPPPVDVAGMDAIDDTQARPDAGTCADMDNDGHPSAACGGDDCDDNNPRRNPGVREVCDNLGVDEDCDPCTVGEVLPSGVGGDGDRDEDGFPSQACFNRLDPGAQPSCTTTVISVDGGSDGGTARRINVSSTETRGTDCDDNSRSRGPTMSEVCDANRLDENCNGTANEGCQCVTGTAMSCADTFGECSRGTQDCIDGRFALCSIMPVDETCDTRDNDCDGEADEGLRVPCYRDVDSDGYAGVGVTVSQECGVSQPDGSRSCPGGFTARAPTLAENDCNDNNALQNPRLVEVPCNGLNDDCNDATSDTSCAGGMTCTAGGCQCPSGQVLCAGRCQAVGTMCIVGTGFCANSMGRTACTMMGGVQSVTCTGSPLMAPNWYPDCDGDGRGNPASAATASCATPTTCGRAMVQNNTDCAGGDSDANTYAGAAERCDGVDNNCNGVADDGYFCVRGTNRTENVLFAGVPATCTRGCNVSCTGHESACTTGAPGHTWVVLGNGFYYNHPPVGMAGGDGSYTFTGTFTGTLPFLYEMAPRNFSGATRYTVTLDYALNSTSGATFNVVNGAMTLGSVAIPNTAGARSTVSVTVTMPGAATSVSSMNAQIVLPNGGVYSPIRVHQVTFAHGGTEPYLF